MKTSLSKEKMKVLFLQYLEEIFKLPEIMSCSVKDVIITRETMPDSGVKALDAAFHDLYSDIDMTIRVRLPENGAVTPEEYYKRIDRFGVNEETALGWMFVPVNHVCRIIFNNGMRYDLIFEFEYEGNTDPDMGKEPSHIEDNHEWPADNINRFWFIQTQALGKLYRRDYLISGHLANMNCNDTLVMQMIMRDLKYKTSHHRYGFAEELEYVNDLGKVPYRSEDRTFNRIADHLYASALAYDRLVKYFYPQYKDRSDVFFSIWDWYESCKNEPGE